MQVVFCPPTNVSCIADLTKHYETTEKFLCHPALVIAKMYFFYSFLGFVLEFSRENMKRNNNNLRFSFRLGVVLPSYSDYPPVSFFVFLSNHSAPLKLMYCVHTNPKTILH